MNIKLLLKKKKQRKSIYRGVSQKRKNWKAIISYKYFTGYIKEL